MNFKEEERQILETIEEYINAKSHSRKLYSKARDLLDEYEIELRNARAAEVRLNWVENQRQSLRKAKDDKTIVKNEVQVKDILVLGEDIDQRLKNLHKHTEEGIQASTMIRLELQRQIEGLDAIYEENMDAKKKIKRAKKGLKQILKRAMLNKLTRCLMVFVLLAIIGLITVSVLKDKGVIKDGLNSDQQVLQIAITTLQVESPLQD